MNFYDGVIPSLSIKLTYPSCSYHTQWRIFWIIRVYYWLSSSHLIIKHIFYCHVFLDHLLITYLSTRMYLLDNNCPIARKVLINLSLMVSLIYFFYCEPLLMHYTLVNCSFKFIPTRKKYRSKVKHHHPLLPGMHFLTFRGFIRFIRFKRLILCFKRIIDNYYYLKRFIQYSYFVKFKTIFLKFSKNFL